MKVSELIKLLQSKCHGDDPDVRFSSYEWDNDLEDQLYRERFVDEIVRRNGVVHIRMSADGGIN